MELLAALPLAVLLPLGAASSGAKFAIIELVSSAPL